MGLVTLSTNADGGELYSICDIPFYICDWEMLYDRG